jgi:hypothetical protein
MQAPNFDELLLRIDPSKRDAVSAQIQNNLAPCISAIPTATAPQDNLGSKLGGNTYLPAELPHPCDRAGKPMLLIAQINFAELPAGDFANANRGLFMLFWNAARDHSNQKDRHAFRCIWVPQPESTSFVPSMFSDQAEIGPAAGLSFNTTWSLPENESAWTADFDPDIRTLVLERARQDRKIQIFGRAGVHFDSLQEIAAFAGNGVTWSPARRSDSCFSHLLENAPEWKMFMQISSLPEYGLDLGFFAMNLMLRQEDHAESKYDKAWLLLA